MDNANNTYSLSQLFNERRFQVPDYQRGYSWDESNITDFLDDLKYLGSDRVHYTGTVVIHPDRQAPDTFDEGGDRLRQIDIVDGQQRLTTAVILLDCIRRKLKDLGEVRLADGIMKRFVRTFNEHGQPIDKLTLNAGTNAFFQGNVLADTPGQLTAKISSERRLEVARQVIERYVASEVAVLSDGQVIGWLKVLHRKITDKLRYSLYEVDSQAEVGIIFEVMNDRGKPLTELEKVKNYLLYAGASLGVDGLAKRVNDAWSTILTGLMNADLELSQDEDRLLRAHWVTRYDPRPQNWRGIHSVKNRFDVRRDARDRTQILRGLTDYVKDLEQSSIPFCDAIEPSVPKAFARFDAPEAIRARVVEWGEKLARTSRLGTPTAVLPLLIAVRLRHPGDVMKYLDTLKLCETYAFRVWMLQESKTNAGQARFFRTAHELRTGHCSFEDAMGAIKDELAWRCGDVEFTRLFKQRVEDARWYGWRGLRYMLYEYENHLATEREASPRVTWEQLDRRDLAQSIEHILPQSIENIPYWRNRFSDEEHRCHRHDIGNLTLSRFNSSLSNLPFPEKKGTKGQDRRYISSPFFQEGDLIHYEDWTPKTIVERRDRIINWAKQRWSIDLSDASDDRDEVDEDDIDDLSEE